MTATERTVEAGRVRRGRTGRVTALASAAILTALAAGVGCREDVPARNGGPEEPTCSGAQALSASNIHGMSLPPKSIALTFDDGPGVRTAELSAYLKSEGVPAAFFVNGKMLAGGTGVLSQLVADGHLVANHTQNHASLTGRATASDPLAADVVVAEVAATDALIAPFVGGRFLFRAPFGDYDALTAAALEASPMKKYVGAINWDIGDHMGEGQAADWDCWIPGADALVLTPAECGALYVSEIDRVGRGIVLLHDPYFIADDPAQGGTVDMVKLIVPTLKAKGYSFVRLDAVPEIAALLPPPPAAGADAGVTPAPQAGDGGAPSGTSSSSGAPTSASPPAAGADPCGRR